MRLAAQAKAGFYPAHPYAVDLALARLKLADPTVLTPILDPCAGAGAALFQIAKALNVAPECVYAIELDAGRAQELKLVQRVIPPENILAPCSFEGTRITHGSFSFIWCNPPYDNEIGGRRRCEYSFLQRCTALLRPGGIMAFVVPERVATENKECTNQLARWYKNISIRNFPHGVRKYGEVIVLAERRRAHAKDEEVKLQWNGVADVPWCDENTEYVIPAGDKPSNFLKVEYTQPELIAAMYHSPLRNLLKAPPAIPLPSPPLSLGTGHIALLLAAGHLDGIVRPEGEMPHVVRGTASKIKYLAHEEERENANGSVTSIQKFCERIVLTVRAVDHEGTIHTFSQE